MLDSHSDIVEALCRSHLQVSSNSWSWNCFCFYFQKTERFLRKWLFFFKWDDVFWKIFTVLKKRHFTTLSDICVFSVVERRKKNSTSSLNQILSFIVQKNQPRFNAGRRLSRALSSAACVCVCGAMCTTECITVNVWGWWGHAVAVARQCWCLGATGLLWRVEVGWEHSEPRQGPSAGTTAPRLALLWKQGPLHRSTRPLTHLWLPFLAWRGTETPWQRHKHAVTSHGMCLFG